MYAQFLRFVQGLPMKRPVVFVDAGSMIFPSKDCWPTTENPNVFRKPRVGTSTLVVLMIIYDYLFEKNNFQKDPKSPKSLSLGIVFPMFFQSKEATYAAVLHPKEMPRGEFVACDQHPRQLISFWKPMRGDDHQTAEGKEGDCLLAGCLFLFLNG